MKEIDEKEKQFFKSIGLAPCTPFADLNNGRYYNPLDVQMRTFELSGITMKPDIILCKIINDIRDEAYEKGRADCQDEIKKALGIKS